MSMPNIIQVVRELLLSRCSAPVPCAAAIRPIPDNCDEVHQTFVFTMFKGRLLCYVYASSNSSCEVLPETAGAGTYGTGCRRHAVLPRDYCHRLSVTEAVPTGLTPRLNQYGS